MSVVVQLNFHRPSSPIPNVPQPQSASFNSINSSPTIGLTRRSFTISIKTLRGNEIRRSSIVVRDSDQNNNAQEEEEEYEEEEKEKSVGVKAALSVLRFYKREISPLLPRSCRYVPTCSEYSMIAYNKYGFSKGTILTVWRLCRCNPLGGTGFDPPRWFGEDPPPKQ
ncbi:UPF0161 protein At3g09310 [Linum perenne]